ncbi:MAG: hypothetical protein WAQ25_01615 [Candidatus Saccharimonas sp.]
MPQITPKLHGKQKWIVLLVLGILLTLGAGYGALHLIANASASRYNKAVDSYIATIRAAVTPETKPESVAKQINAAPKLANVVAGPFVSSAYQKSLAKQAALAYTVAMFNENTTDRSTTSEFYTKYFELTKESANSYNALINDSPVAADSDPVSEQKEKRLLLMNKLLAAAETYQAQLKKLPTGAGAIPLLQYKTYQYQKLVDSLKWEVGELEKASDVLSLRRITAQGNYRSSVAQYLSGEANSVINSYYRNYYAPRFWLELYDAAVATTHATDPAEAAIKTELTRYLINIDIAETATNSDPNFKIGAAQGRYYAYRMQQTIAYAKLSNTRKDNLQKIIAPVAATAYLFVTGATEENSVISARAAAAKYANTMSEFRDFANSAAAVDKTVALASYYLDAMPIAEHNQKIAKDFVTIGKKCTTLKAEDSKIWLETDEKNDVLTEKRKAIYANTSLSPQDSIAQSQAITKQIVGNVTEATKKSKPISDSLSACMKDFYVTSNQLIEVSEDYTGLRASLATQIKSARTLLKS